MLIDGDAAYLSNATQTIPLIETLLFGARLDRIRTKAEKASSGPKAETRLERSRKESVVIKISWENSL